MNTLTNITLNLTGRRRLPEFTRITRFEGGLACLAMISSWYGYEIDMAAMRRRFSTYLKGASPHDLIEIASSLHLSARLLNCTLLDLHSSPMPLILFWDSKRYVVLEKVKGKKYLVSDPFYGRRHLSGSDVGSHFSNLAVELTVAPNFVRGSERTPFKISQIVTWSKDISTAVTQAVILSLFLQLAALLAPYYMQLVIDDVIASGDDSLLTVLAIAFGLLAIFNAAANILRGLAFQFLGYAVLSNLNIKLYRHLFKLPMKFFENRNLGDLFQKFRGTDYIRQFVGAGSIGIFVDAVLAMVTGLLMFAYSVKLALIVLTIVGIYLAVRLLTNSLNTQYFAAMCETDGREAGHFFETVRGIQCFKISNGIHAREAAWRNLFAARMNSNIKLGNVSIFFSAFNVFAASLGDILVVYVAALAVLRGEMTLGVITAFLAYKAQFTTRLFLVADQYSQFKTLDAQIDRISDIALAVPEAVSDPCRSESEAFKGDIVFKDVNFRYAPGARAVVSNLNVKFVSGEFVVIIGSSGAGKSTILKMLLGLIPPDDGEIYIDGLPISGTGTHFLRRHCGALTQESIIFSGTVAENISLFDDSVRMDKVRRAAGLAKMDGDIAALPNQFNTILGEHGASLSSGQVQRLLIARALYKEPKVLVMDEGTANIDPDNEAEIIRAIRELKITCIMATHSLRVAALADRVLELHQGALREVSSETLGSGKQFKCISAGG